MQKRSKRSGSVTFWRNLFLSAAAQQREQILEEIARIESMSAELCRALEPLVEHVRAERTLHPSFYSCVQVLRALDSRRQRLQLYREVDRSSAVFDVQEVLDAPLLVQTNPLESAISSQYGIASNNLESFVSLFVSLLETEAKQSLQ